MKRIKNVSLVLTILLLFLSSLNCWSGKIYSPWRSTTAIVLAGENFEVRFNADELQQVETVRLVGQFQSVLCSYTVIDGDWEVDPLSENRYNMLITVSVPADAPADRYNLLIGTSTGDEISYGGVKVLKEFKSKYYIMHMSDGHLYQSGYDINTLMGRKSAMIDMANIMNCQLIIETGDNMYNVRNHPEREVLYFQGNEELGLNGMADASGATFLVPGDHDAHTTNNWEYENVQVNSDFFNDYWGVQSSSFKYGKGRFMMLNNAWGVSVSNAGDHSYQIDDAIDWLSDKGAGGNFFLSAGHCFNKMHEFINDSQELSLVLAGDKHHVRTDNPYSFDDGSPAIAYIAGSIRDHFEFNLFRVDDETGTFSTVSGNNAVVEVLESGDQDEPESWVPNLTLEFENSNNGYYFENTATIVNKFGFPILDARVRFIMPKGYEYRVTNGSISQEFDGDEFRVIDVILNVGANATAQVYVGDADLCPDDPDKTEPGLCGCGVVEGTCETAELIVQNGTGDGSYYPYEMIGITADVPMENEAFDAWLIISGNPEIADIADPSTELILKGESAEISANYKEIIPVNDAAFISHYIPPALAGEHVTVQITMKNTGNTTWTKHKAYYLGSPPPHGMTSWGLNRVDFDSSDSILPGQEKVFSFQIAVPEKDSMYDFQWQMTHVDSSWFGDKTFKQVIRNAGSNEYLDNCDVKSSWKSSGTLELDASDKKQGSNCLSYSGSSADEFKKAFSTPYNAKGSETGTILQFWYFVSDISKLTGKNQVELGSGGKNDSDEYNWNIHGLTNGWNYIRLPIHSAGTIGNPDLTSINWFRLYSFKSTQITTKIDGIQLISDGVYTQVSLSVNNGTGSGLYETGNRFEIRANEATEGKVFDSWVINVGDPEIDNLNVSITHITLSNTDAEITASYKADPDLSLSHTKHFKHFQVYPNPVKDIVHIEFVITEPTLIASSVYDLSGRKLFSVIDDIELGPGNYIFKKQLGNMLPGVYLHKTSFNNFPVSRVLMKE